MLKREIIEGIMQNKSIVKGVACIMPLTLFVLFCIIKILFEYPAVFVGIVIGAMFARGLFLLGIFNATRQH